MSFVVLVDRMLGKKDWLSSCKYGFKLCKLGFFCLIDLLFVM